MSREVKATVDAARNMGHGTSMLIWVPGDGTLDVRDGDTVTVVVPEARR